MAALRLPRPLISFLAAVLIAALALTGCAAASPSASPGVGSPVAVASPSLAPSPTGPAFPVTVKDDEGTDVTITSEPKKIVSLTPATTETLFAIGAGSRVVGKVQDPANYPPEASTVPEVATYAGVDVEKVIALEPDLVIAGGKG